MINDQSPMPYGIHKDKPMEDVPPDYLLWLYENDRCNKEVKDYIEENHECLVIEAERNRKHQRRTRCSDCECISEIMYGFGKALLCTQFNKRVKWDTPACDDFK